MMYTMGDPGFFGAVFRGARGLAMRALPGGALVSAVASGLSKRGGRPGRPVLRDPGVSGFLSRALPGGSTGFHVGGGGGRRMNVGNAKAARRAVRRIAGVKKLLESIMKTLPRTHCARPHASPRHR